ncbi:MAG: DUF4236 domain-containing protein [Oscillospiraceae bacterium]
MGLRFRKSISLGKFARVSFGKKSVGISFGIKGFRASVNSNGKVTRTVGMPSTGVSYVSTDRVHTAANSPSANPDRTTSTHPQNNKPPVSTKTWFIVLMLILFFPVGLFLMWKKSSWNIIVKWLITAFFALVTIGIAVTRADGTENNPANSGAVTTVSGSNPAATTKPTSKTSKSTTPVAVTTTKPIATSKHAPAANGALVSVGGTDFFPGESATLSFVGKPTTEYHITVYYASGASSAAGLDAKTSDSDGNVSWTWKIGVRTAAGTYRADVSDGNKTDTFDFTVK